MRKLISFSNKQRKVVTVLLAVSFVSVILFSCLTGCSKEDVDKARDVSGKIIDIVDEVDQIEKKIEDIIGEEAPNVPVVEPEEVNPCRYMSDPDGIPCTPEPFGSNSQPEPYVSSADYVPGGDVYIGEPFPSTPATNVGITVHHYMTVTEAPGPNPGPFFVDGVCWNGCA